TNTLANTFTATSTLSSANFTAGVSTTIRIKSTQYNYVYDEVEVMLDSGYTEGLYMVAIKTGAVGTKFAMTSNNIGETWVENDEGQNNLVSVALNEDGSYGLIGGYRRLMTIKNNVVSTTFYDSTNNNFLDVAISKNGQYMLAVGSGGTSIIKVSRDYGLTWSSYGSGGEWFGCDMSESGQYMVVVSSAWSRKARFSNDYGETWVEANGLGAQNYVAMSTDGSKVYTFAYDGANDVGIKWTNNGQTRTVIISGEGGTDFGIDSTGQIILRSQGGTTRQLRLSTNYGSSWSSVGGNADYWGRISVSGNGQYAIASPSYSGGTTLRLSQYPFTTWNVINITKNWQKTNISYSGKYMLASHSTGVYISKDYGANWTDLSFASDAYWGDVEISSIR
ncbi:MAG: hypothetical protein WC414_00005, partial [Patescibacteria group bacterium]